MTRPLLAAVFASGGGTNLQSLLDHPSPGSAWRVGLVVSNRADAGALERAEAAGVPTTVIPTKDRAEADVAAQTKAALQGHAIDLVLLAGYLRLLPSAVVAAFPGRILNVHPALLPSFGGQGMYGMHVHRAVLASGARVSGPTVHFVDEAYDEGRILAQWPVPVVADDTPESLAARVLEAEHALYPLAVDHLCGALAAGRTPDPLDFGTAAWSAVPPDPDPRPEDEDRP